MEVTIQDKRNDEVFSSFPAYGKHDFHGSHYGYLVVTANFEVQYWFVDHSGDCGMGSVDYSDVTKHFTITVQP